MPPSFTSPGASFTGGFNDFFVQKAQQDHQNLLDSLAQKREGRLAQAELDSMQEKQDELQRKKEKDQQDVHDRLEKEFENSRKDMVKGDRYSPEQLDQAKQLHISLFQQAPPPMSTETGAPPAALMPNPPPNATPEGGLPTPVGAMAPQTATYPGSVKERQKEADEAKQLAFIESLPEGDPRKDELRMNFKAESLGLKTPAGFFEKKGAGDTEAVYRQNPRTGIVERIGDVPKGSHFMTEPPPKDTSAREAADAAKVQAAREHGYTELTAVTKGLDEQLGNIRKLRVALDQNTNVADASVMPQLIKTVEGGNGSGVRMTTPLINAELKGSQSIWDAVALKVNSWMNSGGVNPDGSLNPKVPLVLTDEQRAGVKKYVDAVAKSGLKMHETIVKHRRAMDDASTVDEVNRYRSDASDAIAAGNAEPNVPTVAAGPAAPARVRHDMNGNVIP